MIGRTILVVLFFVGGLLHFIFPQMYMRIMPPYLPQPLLLLYISGMAEMLGALGLLIPVTRHAAAWGLVTLLITVWPANIYMATAHVSFAGVLGQSWAQWLRVPLQIPLIYWAWMYTRG